MVGDVLLIFNAPNVGVAVVVIFCGRESVTAPVEAEAVI
jgi:hypothetical protein